MHETSDDLQWLQGVLDDSRGHAGAHLASILTVERGLDAAGVCARLDRPMVLVVATVTADGRALSSPVDGTFYRGRFYFSSDVTSVKLRHLRARPTLSACFAPGLGFAVTVHGEASFVDHRTTDDGALRLAIASQYVPLYGDGFEEFLDEVEEYVKIEPRRLFVFHEPTLPS